MRRRDAYAQTTHPGTERRSTHSCADDRADSSSTHSCADDLANGSSGHRRSHDCFSGVDESGAGRIQKI
jgi:hypothetical protein